MNGPTLTTELEIGPKKRKVYVIDDIIEEKARPSVFMMMRNLPYHFSDFDRSDTKAVRHLVHYFERAQYKEHAVLRSMTVAARDFLGSRGHRVHGVERIYANFNLYGDYQFAHTDGDVWTALVFMNAEWKSDFGGELMLYDDDAPRAPAWAIQPEPGRMVIFDGQILHRGGVPSKYCLDPRISLAVKLLPGSASSTAPKKTAPKKSAKTPSRKRAS